jgi:hypothetical protein
MWDAHQPALLSYGGDRLDGGHSGRDSSLQESGDQVSVGRLHFLTDDDCQTIRSSIASPQGPVDPVVVRNRQVSEPANRRGAGYGARTGE